METYLYCFSPGEIVLFCKPSDLQLRLYCQMLQGKMFRSCLRSDGATHLVCIGALKKLCNHPSLIFSKATQAEECHEDIEEVKIPEVVKDEVEMNPLSVQIRFKNNVTLHHELAF